MLYGGRHDIFDPRRIKTYPLGARANKVNYGDLVYPTAVNELIDGIGPETRRQVGGLAEAIVEHRRADKPVVLFTGAHLIKNGLGPLIVDLIERGVFTLIAGNGATAIHDFELALVGETSENVPQGLENGAFGMAYEFAYINTALSLGDEQNLGYGESLGRTICDDDFRSAVFAKAARNDSPRTFAHPQVSLLAASYRQAIAFTVHVGIGADVIDQHPSFDGRAKGGCSGRDFLIYVNELSKFSAGGVALNVGSAVTGPEVLLKAVAMVANVGCPPRGIVTADFDLRRYDPAQMDDEASAGYYFRDQKSVVTRIPEALDGTGLYVQGNQRQTIPLLYREIVDRWQ